MTPWQNSSSRMARSPDSGFNSITRNCRTSESSTTSGLSRPLRAADGLKLASALVWAEESPKGLDVVCLDQNMHEAASREGFTVLP